jgi:hypothetical protein
MKDGHSGEGHVDLRLLKPAGLHKTGGMPELSSSTVMILLSSAVGLLVLLLGMIIGISRRLTRMERWLVESENRQGSGEASPSLAETSAGGAFETFLKEDPARRKLPKGEQFAEYRRWRQENGMNWSNS